MTDHKNKITLTGVQIRERIRAEELRRDLSATEFPTSLYAFEDDDKSLSPAQHAENFLDAERKVAQLQTLQTRYNLLVQLNVLGEKMSLAEAVKRLGGAGRLTKMWTSAAKDEGKDRYGYGSDRLTRDKSQERARRQVTKQACAEAAGKAARFAGELRAAVARGNGTPIDFDDVEPSLFS